MLHDISYILSDNKELVDNNLKYNIKIIAKMWFMSRIKDNFYKYIMCSIKYRIVCGIANIYYICVKYFGKDAWVEAHMNNK